MSHIILDENGLRVAMNIDSNGVVTGEVFEKEDRFGAVSFKVNGLRNIDENDRAISVSLPGTSASGGKAVDVMFRKISMARGYAERIHSVVKNYSKSYDSYLCDVLIAVKTENVNDTILKLALTPEGIDADRAKKALVAVTESKLLGDLTSKRGLDVVSDTVFHALYNAIIALEGKDVLVIGENKKLHPNQAMANFLRELQDNVAA